MIVPAWPTVEHRFRVLGWTLEDALLTPYGELPPSRIPPPPRRRNLVGERFGAGVVVAFGGVTYQRNPVWVVQCDCDPRGERLRVVRGHELLAGRSLTCGNRLAHPRPGLAQPKLHARPDLGEIVSAMKARHRAGRVA